MTLSIPSNSFAQVIRVDGGLGGGLSGSTSSKGIGGFATMNMDFKSVVLNPRTDGIRLHCNSEIDLGVGGTGQAPGAFSKGNYELGVGYSQYLKDLNQKQDHYFFQSLQAVMQADSDSVLDIYRNGIGAGILLGEESRNAQTQKIESDYRVRLAITEGKMDSKDIQTLSAQFDRSSSVGENSPWRIRYGAGFTQVSPEFDPNQAFSILNANAAVDYQLDPGVVLNAGIQYAKVQSSGNWVPSQQVLGVSVGVKATLGGAQ